MTRRVLICEDSEQVAEKLAVELQKLVIDGHGEQLLIDYATTERAVRHINSHLSDSDFDLILLDYYAPDGNFHVLDFQKIDVKNVIAMSSMADKNQLAVDRGVSCSVTKTNPLTDGEANEIIHKAEYILYANYSET